MENKHKEFKPYDRVLVKYGKVWVVDFYRNYVESTNIHLTLTGTSYDNDILPYEGNEHLVGTTDEPEEEVELEFGEFYFGAYRCNYEYIIFWHLFQLDCIDFDKNVFKERFGKRRSFDFIIPFSDFNPDDMKETRKHILCVKNGKVVRYKE